MWQTILLSLLAGVVGGNAIPHFIKGITKENYPNLLGNSPVPNLISGWVALIITVLLVCWAQVAQYPWESLGFAALGVLLIGLFHAWHGAVGRRS